MRGYYSGLGRYKRKRSYKGMRKSYQKMTAGTIVHRDTRYMTRKQMSTVFPDQAYVTLDYDDVIPIGKPDAEALYFKTTQIALNSPTNVLCVESGEAVNAAGFEQFAALYSDMRVEAFTVRASLVTYGTEGLPLQLIAYPVEPGEALPVSEDEVKLKESAEMSRSVISGGTGSDNTVLVYQSSIPVLEGSRMGEESRYEFITLPGDRPARFWRMALIVYNFAGNDNVNPSFLQISIRYRCRCKSRLPIQNTLYTETGLQLAEKMSDPVYRKEYEMKRKHTKIEEHRTESEYDESLELMSAASSTISGFSKLMAAKSMSGRR